MTDATEEHMETDAQTSTNPTGATNHDDTPTTKPAESTPSASVQTPNPLSKSQQKKRRRKEEWEAGREDRKAVRKEKMKSKKEQKRAAQKGAGGNQNGNTRVKRPPPATQVPITIVFDCQFDSLMSESELVSLGSQLTRCYSDNKKSRYRAHLVVSSFGGRLKERFEGILESHHNNWRGVRFMEEDWVAVGAQAAKWMTESGGGVIAGALPRPTASALEASTALKAPETSAPDTSATEASATEASAPEASAPEVPVSEAPISELPGTTEPKTEPVGEVIYLSSDSDETLTELKPYHTYIIGGLVDRNRHKGICYKRALEAGVRTAKLPIGEFLQMSTRAVLATNHVSEIMLKWLEVGDWGKAFMEVIPKRKGGSLKKGGDDVKSTPDDEQDQRVESSDDASDRENEETGDGMNGVDLSLTNEKALESQEQDLKRKHENDSDLEENTESKRVKDNV